MDLRDLPSLVQTKVFCFLDSFSLLSAIQVDRWFRNQLTKSCFLESYCRSNFGLSRFDLPELAKWEELFVNTRRLMFQKSPIVDSGDDWEGDRWLMRIHMLDYRLGWLARRLLLPGSVEYPFVLDWDWWAIEAMEKHPIVRGMRRLLIRLTVVAPLDVFRIRMNSWGHGFALLHTGSEISWAYRRFFADPVGDRATVVIEFRTTDGDYGPTLKIVLYEDDGWRVIFEGPMLPANSEPIIGRRIRPEMDLAETRRRAAPLVDRLYGFYERDPPYRGPFTELFLSVRSNPILEFQQDCTKRLDERLVSISTELELRLLPTMAPRQRRNVIDYLDRCWPCVNLDHGNECSRRNPSTILRVALTRALRRLVNSIYSYDVRNLYFEDSDSSRLIRAFFVRFDERSRLWKELSFPDDRHGSRRRAVRGGAVVPFPRSVCSHRSFPEAWPIVIVVEAIERVPLLAEQLETDVIGFVKTRRCGGMEERYLYSLGYTLRMFERR